MIEKVILSKESLIHRAIFKNDEYSLHFDKKNRFCFLIPGNTNFLSIYNKNGDIMLMINVDRDGELGLNIETSNRILENFGFNIEVD